MGLNMKEGVLAEWLVEDGQAVHEGQPFYIVETDKITNEIEAETDGTLRHVAGAGDSIPVTGLVGYILAEGEELAAEGQGATVEIIAHGPEQVQLKATLDAPGYLVLTDAEYPGWEAEVDGSQPVPIQRADLYFRAVALDAGEHQVTFRFRPLSVRIGMGIGLVSWLVWGLAAAIAARRFGRKDPTGV